MAEVGQLQKPPGYRNSNIPLGQPSGRPPKPRPPRSGYQPKKKRRSCCCVCCCCFCAFFFILIILAAIFAAYFYLWFNPKPPSFQLQSFQVTQLKVNAKPDGTYLDARTTSRVAVENPNKKISFYYGATEVAVSAGEGGETGLGSANVGEFSQEHEMTTSLKVDTTVANQLVEDRMVAKLRDQFESKALVLNVEARTQFGFGFWGLKFGMFKVDVNCGGLSMKQLEAGGKPKCNIIVLNWINIH